MTGMKRMATNKTREFGRDSDRCDGFADQNDPFVDDGEILEADRVHSIVGALFTAYKFYRFIDFPNDPGNLIRAHLSNLCPLELELESTSGEATSVRHRISEQ